jgi:RNA polymerase sigma-70 factor (ECF subfamily)
MKVYKNLHRFDGSGSLEGWVRRVISNNIKDEIRKNKIELHNGEYDISRIELPVEDYEEPNVDNIIKVIPMLPPSYRNTFELYYLRGYSHKEIAKMLGVSENTSKTNLMKGRNIIKKYFRDNSQIDI